MMYFIKEQEMQHLSSGKSARPPSTLRAAQSQNAEATLIAKSRQAKKEHATILAKQMLAAHTQILFQWIT
jgi:hypothetical protein